MIKYLTEPMLISYGESNMHKIWQNKLLIFLKGGLLYDGYNAMLGKIIF